MAIEWMETLEQRVREAADEIRRLRTENDALEERIETLERELAQAVASGGAEPRADADDGAWEQERAEVRSRVERLVVQLEGLIKEAETAEA